MSAKKPAGEPVNILTHCNAGWLATVDWGTATAPKYLAFNEGINIHVWVDETRPRNQGASLTAYELGQHGVNHTIIVPTNYIDIATMIIQELFIPTRGAKHSMGDTTYIFAHCISHSIIVCYGVNYKIYELFKQDIKSESLPLELVLLQTNTISSSTSILTIQET